MRESSGYQCQNCCPIIENVSLLKILHLIYVITHYSPVPTVYDLTHVVTQLHFKHLALGHHTPSSF